MGTGIATAKIASDLTNWATYSKSDKIMMIVIIILGIGSLSIIITYLMDENIWTVEPASVEEINLRQNNRGIVASLLTSFISMAVSVIMLVGMKSDSSTYQALVSIICLGLVGFLLDNSIATESGVSVLLKGIDGNSELSFKTLASSLKYSFGSLLTDKTPRFFIVSMLDIFISLMLTDGIVWGLTRKAGVNQSLADIFGMVVVAVTTFLAYSNATRLEWAYPAVDTFHERSALIPTPVILISTVIAGMVYMIWTPRSTPEQGVTSPGGKLVMVLILFVLIVASYYGGWLDAVLKDEIKNDVVDCPPTSKSINGRCVESVVETNDIPTIKDQYDNGTIGVIVFLVLCAVCTFVVAGSSAADPTKFINKNLSISKYTPKNIALGVTVVGIMLTPGIISLFG